MLKNFWFQLKTLFCSFNLLLSQDNLLKTLKILFPFVFFLFLQSTDYRFMASGIKILRLLLKDVINFSTRAIFRTINCAFEKILIIFKLTFFILNTVWVFKKLGWFLAGIIVWILIISSGLIHIHILYKS